MLGPFTSLKGAADQQGTEFGNCKISLSTRETIPPVPHRACPEEAGLCCLPRPQMAFHTHMPVTGPPSALSPPPWCFLPLPSSPPAPTSITYLWRSPSKHPAPLGNLWVWSHQSPCHLHHLDISSRPHVPLAPGPLPTMVPGPHPHPMTSQFLPLSGLKLKAWRSNSGRLRHQCHISLHVPGHEADSRPPKWPSSLQSQVPSLGLLPSPSPHPLPLSSWPLTQEGVWEFCNPTHSALCLPSLEPESEPRSLLPWTQESRPPAPPPPDSGV